MDNWVNGGICHLLQNRKFQMELAAGICGCGGRNESMRSVVAMLQLMSHRQNLLKDILPSDRFVHNHSLLR